MTASQPSVLLTQPGTQHSRHLAQQLAREGLLSRFVTGAAIRDTSPLAQLLPTSLTKRFSNRLVRELDSTQLVTQPWGEFLAMAKLNLGYGGQEVFFDRNRRFQERIPQRFIDEADVVIGMDTASWILAERARAENIPFILDQSALHHLLHSQAMLTSYPGNSEVERLLQDLPEQYLACYDMELRQADAIVCASSFARRSLIEAGVSADKIQVITYGIGEEFSVQRQVSTRDTLRFIYAGIYTYRKGIPFLAEAISGLEGQKYQLALAGSGPLLSMDAFHETAQVEILGNIDQRSLAQEMAQSDVFVLPTVSDGFGLVIIEALRCGLPVIATEHSAGPDIIEHGIDGLIVPAADSEALAEAMKYMIDNPDQLEQMSQAALAKGRQFTWESYGAQWTELLMSHYSK